MRAVAWTWLLALLMVVATLGEAKSTFPWFKEVRGSRTHGVDSHKKPQREENNFYYPGTEYFEKEESVSASDSDDYYDYSGYEYDSDDEDFSRDNVIAQMPRADRPSSWHRDPKAPPPEFPYLYDLDEGDFGNEIHDIDKIDELKKRMADIQERLQEMQTLLKGQRKGTRRS